MPKNAAKDRQIAHMIQEIQIEIDQKRVDPARAKILKDKLEGVLFGKDIFEDSVRDAVMAEYNQFVAELLTDAHKIEFIRVAVEKERTAIVDLRKALSSPGEHKRDVRASITARLVSEDAKDLSNVLEENKQVLDLIAKGIERYKKDNDKKDDAKLKSIVDMVMGEMGKFQLSVSAYADRTKARASNRAQIDPVLVDDKEVLKQRVKDNAEIDQIVQNVKKGGQPFDLMPSITEELNEIHKIFVEYAKVVDAQLGVRKNKLLDEIKTASEKPELKDNADRKKFLEDLKKKVEKIQEIKDLLNLEKAFQNLKKVDDIALRYFKSEEKPSAWELGVKDKRQAINQVYPMFAQAPDEAHTDAFNRQLNKLLGDVDNEIANLKQRAREAKDIKPIQIPKDIKVKGKNKEKFTGLITEISTVRETAINIYQSRIDSIWESKGKGEVDISTRQAAVQDEQRRFGEFLKYTDALCDITIKYKKGNRIIGMITKNAFQEYINAGGDVELDNIRKTTKADLEAFKAHKWKNPYHTAALGLNVPNANNRINEFLKKEEKNYKAPSERDDEEASKLIAKASKNVGVAIQAQLAKWKEGKKKEKPKTETSESDVMTSDEIDKYNKILVEIRHPSAEFPNAQAAHAESKRQVPSSLPGMGQGSPRFVGGGETKKDDKVPKEPTQDQPRAPDQQSLPKSKQ